MSDRRRSQPGSAEPRMPGHPVPAHLRPYVEVLGPELAVDFLLELGGGVSYLSESPQLRSPVAEIVGTEKTAALARRLGSGSLRIPTGKPFIARFLRDRHGLTVTQIARKLHMTDVSVRTMLRPSDSHQLTLFPLPPPVSKPL